MTFTISKYQQNDNTYQIKNSYLQMIKWKKSSPMLDIIEVVKMFDKSLQTLHTLDNLMEAFCIVFDDSNIKL